MTGTAATMDIEENMAIALRRGEENPSLGCFQRTESYSAKLQTLGLGLEDRMTSKVGCYPVVSVRPSLHCLWQH